MDTHESLETLINADVAAGTSQFNRTLVKYVGSNILEVGSGDRGFTQQFLSSEKTVERIVSIEPSTTLFSLYANKFSFPDFVSFYNLNLFSLSAKEWQPFDTIAFIHVLEHIEQDREALDHAFGLLKPDGHVLIEVPALPFLYSVHDEMLGHFRRYNKAMLKSVIDENKYIIKKIWYQDPIGVIGSYYFFKLRKIKLKSDKGVNLVNNEGAIYDKYVIPFENMLEKFISFPFGLSLTAVLQRR